MINTQALRDELTRYAPHVNKLRREDWLNEAILVDTYNADITKSFETPEKRDAFIEELVKKDIRRLGSFGGNDIAAFWLDHNDIFSPFTNEEGLPQNTQSVIESKLCIIAPTRMTGDMIRGVALEPMAKLDFERQMSANGFTPRPDMLEIFTSLYDNRIPEHPWLVGMPDGIYEDRNGDIYVVDFKVPANADAVRDMQRDPPEGYNAQMGTYEAILGFHNIRVKHRILAPMSIKTMETTPIIMPEVKDFTKTLLGLGDNAWHHVINGTIPNRDYDVGDLTKIEKVDDSVERSANRFAYFNALKKAVEDAMTQERRIMEWMLKKHHDITPDQGKKVKLPVGISYSTTTPKPSLSKDALARKYVDLGGDIEDPDLYITPKPSTRINITTSKKDPYTPRLDQFRSLAVDMFKEAEEEVNEVVGEAPEKGGEIRADEDFSKEMTP